VILAQLEPREIQEVQVQLVIQDLLGLLVSKVLLAIQAHKVHLDKDLIFEVHTLQEQFTMSTL